jgi:hypothetical protein
LFQGFFFTHLFRFSLASIRQLQLKFSPNPNFKNKMMHKLSHLLVVFSLLFCLNSAHAQTLRRDQAPNYGIKNNCDYTFWSANSFPSPTNREVIPEFTVYPNPINSIQNSHVEAKLEGTALYSLIDMNGRVVFSTILTHNQGKVKSQLRPHCIASGLQSLTAQTDELTTTKKVLIQK